MTQKHVVARSLSFLSWDPRNVNVDAPSLHHTFYCYVISDCYELLVLDVHLLWRLYFYGCTVETCLFVACLGPILLNTWLYHGSQ